MTKSVDVLVSEYDAKIAEIRKKVFGIANRKGDYIANLEAEIKRVEYQLKTKGPKAKQLLDEVLDLILLKDYLEANLRQAREK